MKESQTSLPAQGRLPLRSETPWSCGHFWWVSSQSVAWPWAVYNVPRTLFCTILCVVLFNNFEWLLFSLWINLSKGQWLPQVSVLILTQQRARLLFTRLWTINSQNKTRNRSMYQSIIQWKQSIKEIKLNVRVLEVSNYYKCLLSISELLIDQEHTGWEH